jgi:hypothetical protein
MNDEFENVTTAAYVEIYQASNEIFDALLAEVRELSKKKPEATMSPGKVKIVNRVLKDLLTFLKDQPEGKYLEELDDDALPQVSDAVLIMVQFQAALQKFVGRYRQYVSALGGVDWITEELLAELEQITDEDDDQEEDEEEPGTT